MSFETITTISGLSCEQSTRDGECLLRVGDYLVIAAKERDTANSQEAHAFTFNVGNGKLWCNIYTVLNDSYHPVVYADVGGEKSWLVAYPATHTVLTKK